MPGRVDLIRTEHIHFNPSKPFFNKELGRKARIGRYSAPPGAESSRPPEIEQARIET
jgi:hypothetical protein